MRSYAMAALVLLAGCGSAGSVSGTVSGNALSAKDGFGNSAAVEGGRTVTILLGDQSGLCDAARSNKEPKGLTFLLISLSDATVNGTSVTLSTPSAGDYNVASAQNAMQGKNAVASFSKSDASCRGTSLFANSGTVTVKSIDATTGKASGTFDLTFQSDHLTGSFEVDGCSVPQADGGTTCS